MYVLITLEALNRTGPFQPNSTTAINGSWRKAPGSELFQKLKSELPNLPIIAEDLGIITPAVKQLMQETGFPGMSVLHFAFGDSNDNAYLPHNHIPNQVVYTGTHDNNTSIGWFNKLDTSTKTHVQKYLGFQANILAGIYYARHFDQLLILLLYQCKTL